MSLLQRIFHRNLPIKIMAILTAVILWFYVMNEQNPPIEATITRDVQMVNVPEETLVSLQENKVRIKMRALRSYFVSASDNDFRAEVNVGDLEEGLSMERVKVILPHGFELMEVDPPALPVVADKMVKRSMNVSIVTTGVPMDGTTLAGITGERENVEIIGPRTKVAQAARIVAYVPLTNHDKDFQQRVHLMVVGIQGRIIDGVTAIPAAMSVDVQLARGLTKKIVTVSPAIVGQLAEGYIVDRVAINPAKIEIAGRKEVIDKIQSIATQDIDLSDIEPEDLETGLHTADVQLRHTPGVVVIDRTVKVDITTKRKGSDK